MKPKKPRKKAAKKKEGKPKLPPTEKAPPENVKIGPLDPPPPEEGAKET